MLLCSFSASACDDCSVYLNLMPNDNRSAVSLFYRSRLMMGSYSSTGQQLLTKHTGHGKNPTFWGNTVSETYRTYEVRGRFQISERWRTYLILPFIQNSQRINNNRTLSVSGFGDPTIMSSFQFFDPTQVKVEGDVIQQLELGAGLKAPLGKIDKSDNGALANLDLQPGTGSIDYLGFLRYSARWSNFGLNASASYKYNSKNQMNYKYGNATNAALSFFYQTKLVEFTFVPVLGGGLEQSAMDRSNIVHDDTGGERYYASSAVYLFWKGIQLFGEFQRSVFNKMRGDTQLITKFNINFGLTYNF